jgi:poly-gamma-glutamate synthesis protein (capsule biosynthesis protein)
MGNRRLRIAAVGDVLLHSPLQRAAYAATDGGRALWSEVEPLFRAADLAYANLEGPLAPGMTNSRNKIADPGPIFDDRVYTSYPLFNYHPRIARDLKLSGVDIVSTANNHALDRGSVGVDLTLAELARVGLPATGTIATGAKRNFTRLTQSPLGQVAWIACTYSTNGMPDPNDQTLMCYEDTDEMLDQVRMVSRRSDVAAVIVTPHWGDEYAHVPALRQKTLTQQFIRAGATAVIGTHPHVLQPWDTIGKGVVFYSTGNFVSGQVGLPRRTGAIAWLELCMTAPDPDFDVMAGNQLQVADVAWLPLMMTRGNEGPRVRPVWAPGTGLRKSTSEHAARHLAPGTLRLSKRCDAGKELVALQ